MKPRYRIRVTLVRKIFLLVMGTLRGVALDLDPNVIGVWPEFVRGAVCDMAVIEDYAFVSKGFSGLDVIDIRDRRRPVRVGGTGEAVGRVTLVGNRLYSSSYPGSVFDISDPANIRKVDRFAVDTENTRVVSDQRALALDRGLRLLDISDPALPRLLSAYRTNAFGGYHDATISGDLVYVATGSHWDGEGTVDGGLHVVRLNPLGNLEGVGTYLSENLYASSVAVSGNYAYLTAGFGEFVGSGLVIADVSNPARPQEVGRMVFPRQYWNRIMIAGLYGYVLGSDSSGGFVKVLTLENPQAPEIIGRFGSADYSSILLSENHAFVGGQLGLQIFDVTRPANAVLLGSSLTSGSANAVVLSGEHAFLADGSAGLAVIEITDAAHPKSLSRYATRGPARDVAVAGNYAYLAVGTAGLEVVEISDRTSPQLAGSLEWGGEANRIALSGNYLYLADGGLQVIDISEPSRPVLVGRHQGDHFASSVAFYEGYVYVGGGPSVVILDVHDPANLRPVSLPAADWPDSWALCAAVSGNQLYLSGAGLHILDISRPASPVLISSDFFDRGAQDLEVIGNHAYLAGTYGLSIVDISRPEAPRRVGGYNRAASGLAVSETKVFLAEGDYGGVTVLDVRRPAIPQRVNDGYRTSISDVVFSGNFAYVSPEAAELRIFAFSNPLAPQLAGRGSFAPAGMGICGTVDGSPVPGYIIPVSNTYLYLGGCWGWQAIDISDISNPRQAGWVSGFDYGSYVAAGNYLYIGGYNREGLRVFDLKNPLFPVRVGQYLSGANITAVAKSGDVVYVLVSDSFDAATLHIVDVRNPANPVGMGRYPLYGYVSALAAFGNHVLLARGDSDGPRAAGTLEIIDAGDPLDPRRVGAYNYRGTFSKLVITGTYLHASLAPGWQSGPQGFEVLDISNPAEPRRVGANSTVSFSNLQILSGKLLVASPSGFDLLHAFRPVRFEPLPPMLDSNLRLRVGGPPGVRGTVQRSTDLIHWADLLPVNFDETSAEISVPATDSHPHRFFRVEIP